MVRERYNLYYADKDYYKKKFEKLSRSSNIVTTDVADTIEWALPSMMKIFTGSNDVITVQGVGAEDDQKAEVLQQLLTYQLQRQNNFFTILYNWFKDSFITGFGVVKCMWEREEKTEEIEETVSYDVLAQMTAQGLDILSVEPDQFGDFKVRFLNTTYMKNQPKIENVFISEVLYTPDAKSMDEAPFVAHKMTKTLSYLRQKEKEGVYANIDEVESKALSAETDDLLQDVTDYYENFKTTPLDKARRKVTIYECYTKIDINEDGILEDMIITVCENVILRIEENYLNRHPFFVLSPIKDPHRIMPKRSYADLIGELQDQKIALQRQAMINIALSNDPKMLLSEEAVNINDYVQGKAVIRKKPGYNANDVVMPLPPTPLHPWTFQYMEYIETQKENRTGITRYNQGLDARSLNKTATGISQIMSASNQRLELVARNHAETGILQLYRFLISLNQKFMDQTTVVRLTNKPLTVNPEDLQGDFDLVVNAGIGISTKEANMLNLQTFMTALMQVLGMGMNVATPTNIFNSMKKWLEEAGLKNYTDYITDPLLVQQKAMMEMAMKQQAIMSLPPELQQYYLDTGTLPPEILMQLPPQLQMIIMGGTTFGNGTPVQGGPAGRLSQPPGGVPQGMVGQLQRMDNRTPQNVPRSGNGPMEEPTGGM